MNLKFLYLICRNFLVLTYLFTWFLSFLSVGFEFFSLICNLAASTSRHLAPASLVPEEIYSDASVSETSPSISGVGAQNCALPSGHPIVPSSCSVAVSSSTFPATLGSHQPIAEHRDPQSCLPALPNSRLITSDATSGPTLSSRISMPEPNQLSPSDEDSEYPKNGQPEAGFGAQAGVSLRRFPAPMERRRAAAKARGGTIPKTVTSARPSVAPRRRLVIF
ncbi:unnamed protein product [Protopolystoma xenopodis]|uniref:Uncharacterized protein n=1 Tax=Protopolystoma xenopodis TaxID=117903 RepID=A0A3S5CJP3_9PLAT|nr:unnamed protein product [Protopolystoma xenopodis]